MKRVCVVIGSRANYASIKSVLEAFQTANEIKLQIVLMGSALSSRYGDIGVQIEQDGFEINYRIDSLLENSLPSTMAKTTGLTLIEMATCLDHLNPDIVFTIGDRYETIATAIASAYTNRILVHTMGGELTGTIDESVRHAVTKLSHLHFVATRQSKLNILQMGESEEYVHVTGCPRIDFVKSALANVEDSNLSQRINEIGVGSSIDLLQPFLILALHPVTTEWRLARSQIEISLQAAEKLKLPTIVVWPNADAGTSEMARGIRSWRETHSDHNFRFVSDLNPEDFFQLMSKCSLMIGNSSAGIREGSFIGTPFLNLGSRQSHREFASNTTHSDWSLEEILTKARIMLEKGPFETCNLYGDGHASKRIVSLINDLHPNIQKRFEKRQVIT